MKLHVVLQVLGLGLLPVGGLVLFGWGVALVVAGVALVLAGLALELERRS